jgi:transaldolase / glucose-6-phosphate isomerase
VPARLIERESVVERIWSRDATLWTGRDETKWLGWLDEPKRMAERAGELEAFAVATAEFAHIVLLGMGGSSLAPEVLRRTFSSERLHVLDTTHPAAVRRIAEELDLDGTLFVVASKSGTTLETRCHLDFFWERLGRGDSFVAITDPGSDLEALARERGFRAVFSGEPTIGGRYSALSVFGLVPAALLNVDLTRFLERVEEMAEACRLGTGNPGLELGESLGQGGRDGRDKVQIGPDAHGFGLWAEQLIAESTGKEGKGLVPVPSERFEEGFDRQAAEVRIPDPYELGQEFYRWEFATAVAGSILGINPFDQPNVQEAKDRTNEVLSSPDGDAAGFPQRGQTPVSASDGLEELLAGAEPPEYVCIQAFIDPAREAELQPLIARAGESGCVVTHGLGPRYLHSTGQLHKGGPPTGKFIQVLDDPGEELPIPSHDFGFARLIKAQAAGDFAALEQRGRPIVRIDLEEVAAG